MKFVCVSCNPSKERRNFYDLLLFPPVRKRFFDVSFVVVAVLLALYLDCNN